MRPLVLVASLTLACSGKGSSVQRSPVEHPPPVVPSVGSGLQLHAFVGEQVSRSGLPADGTATPPLPAGLTIDSTGRLRGVATAPVAGTLVQVSGHGQEVLLHLEIITRPTATDRFVATTGSDDNLGTIDHPMRTIRRALQGTQPGSRVFLRAGDYTEDVDLNNVHGIELRGYPGEAVRLLGDRIDIDWKRNEAPDAAPDEWVSTKAWPVSGENLANRGAFLEREPYTRLLTYSRLEDLRARNERWTLGGSEPASPQKSEPRRPWTYFGPGVWQDPASGVIHLRLSATHNHVAGRLDYEGANKVPVIGLWYRASLPLQIHKSAGIEVHDLTVFGGGERSVDIESSERVVLDHVNIRGASESFSVRQSTDVSYAHGTIDGGVPPWTFRSDYKDNYQIETANGYEPNNLIRKTSRALLAINDGNRKISISYCEIENGHDSTFSGIGSELHHCRIRDIQDDALFISHTTQIDDMRIHDNVFERVMTALSGEGRRTTGPRYVYRNIFDLRGTVPGWRPGLKDDVWRYGTLFKGDFSAGPLYFYHNTVLLSRPGDQIALALFRSLEKTGAPINARWFVGNVVTVDTDTYDQSLAFIPEASYLAARRADGTPLLYSDGNYWIRPSSAKTPMFKCMTASSTKCSTRAWSSLGDLHKGGVEFERHSKVGSKAPFSRLRSQRASAPDDDFRLSESTATIPLPKDLPDSSTSSEVGALPAKAPAQRLGVDGRLRY